MERQWSQLDYQRLSMQTIDTKSFKSQFPTIQDWLLHKHLNGQLSKEKTVKWWFKHQKIRKDQSTLKLTSQWSTSRIWVMRVLSNSVIHLRNFKLSSILDLLGLGSSLKIVVRREFAQQRTRNSYSLNLILSKWMKKVARCFSMAEVLSWVIHQKTRVASHLIQKVACLNSISWLL